METHKKVEEWAKRLGYKGKIPNSLKNICGPRTAHIWEQLVANVKPKQEIEHVRNNLIIHRLKEDKMKYDGRRNAPLQEIEVYNKREKLKLKISELRDDSSVKTEELESLEKNLSLKSTVYKNLMDEITENKQKTFLYQKKLEQFENVIANAQEMLDFAVSVTPTEEHQDNKQVAETLKKCAEKIRRSLLKADVPIPAQTITDPFLEEASCLNTLIEESSIDYNKELEWPKCPLSQRIAELNDDEFLKDIKNISCGKNFENTQSIFLDILRERNVKLADAIRNKYFAEPENQDNSEVLYDMYAADIENNLLIIKYNKESDALNKTLEDKTMEIYAKFDSLNLSPDQVNAMREIFLMQLDEVAAEATVKAIEEISTALSEDCNVIKELESVKSKGVELHQQLLTRAENIRVMLRLHKQIYQTIMVCQHEIKRLLEKLQELTDDLSWLTPLTEKLNTKEIETFKKFNLKYNRKVNLMGDEVFAREILEDTFNVSDLDQNTLQIIQTITERLDETPEVIFSSLLQAKAKLHTYESQGSISSEFTYKKYSLDNLEQQEALVNSALCKLEGVLNEAMSSTPQYSVSHIKKIMDFWLEMPIKEFISPHILFEGQNISYYQKIYDNMYNKL